MVAQVKLIKTFGTGAETRTPTNAPQTHHATLTLHLYIFGISSRSRTRISAFVVQNSFHWVIEIRRGFWLKGWDSNPLSMINSHPCYLWHYRSIFFSLVLTLWYIISYFSEISNRDFEKIGKSTGDRTQIYGLETRYSIHWVIDLYGLNGRIWTCDVPVPDRATYQAGPHWDIWHKGEESNSLLMVLETIPYPIQFKTTLIKEIFNFF